MGEKGKGEFVIDLKDDVVRGSIVLQDGKLMFPPPALAVPAPSPPKKTAIVKPPEQSAFSAAAWETGLTTGMCAYTSQYFVMELSPHPLHLKITIVKPLEQSPLSAAAWKTGLTTGTCTCMRQYCHGVTRTGTIR